MIAWYPVKDIDELEMVMGMCQAEGIEVSQFEKENTIIASLKDRVFISMATLYARFA